MSLYMPGAVQRPQPGGVTLDTSLPPRVVWHITWDQLRADGSQPDFSAVADYLISKEYCPHIMWNPFTGYMEQFYPANVGGRALAYNNQDGAACVQVEVFFSPGCVVDGVKYATVADTPLVGFEDLLAWGESLGIPRTWPMGAPRWSGNSRDAGIWNGNAGHYGHCHSPGDNHTDPGPMPPLTGTLSVQGAIIPATTESFLMALTDQQQNDLYYILCTAEGRAERAQQDAKALLASAVAMLDGGNPTVAELLAVFNDRLKHINDGTDLIRPLDVDVRGDLAVKGRQLSNMPAAVLNQTFTLPDGAVTNLAGILAAIHATPTGTATAAVSDPQAVVRALATQLNK